MIDRIRQLQDDPECDAVILNSYDWKGAFDRLDFTEVAVECINLGNRGSIVKVVIYFMNEWKMQVKLNQHTSHDLTWGEGAQESFLGQLLYNTAEDIPE